MSEYLRDDETAERPYLLEKRLIEARKELKRLREVRARVKDIEDDTGRFEAIVVIGKKRICPVQFAEWGEAIAENINDALENKQKSEQ